MYDTNEHAQVYVPGSKLVQHKVFMTECRVGESCYELSVRLRRWNSDIPILGWSSDACPTTSSAILSWSSYI